VNKQFKNLVLSLLYLRNLVFLTHARYILKSFVAFVFFLLFYIPQEKLFDQHENSPFFNCSYCSRLGCFYA